MHRRALPVALIVATAWIAACGGNGGGGDDSGPGDVKDVPDVADVRPDVAPEVPDPGVDTVEIADVPQDDGGEPECTPETMANDCWTQCKDLGPCQKCACNTDLGGGTCQVVPKPNDTACDDGDACSRDDTCQEGACAAGTPICECQQNEDCASLEDGDKCNGTLFCNRLAFPYKCKVDPVTVVTCPSTNDTDCTANQCDAITGACGMRAIHEGEACLREDDQCALAAACQEGTCTATEVRNCDEGNPCMDASCDPHLGCVRVPNTKPCDDGNACTEDDTCYGGSCRAGTPKVCGDGQVCNGSETCDPASGCGAGTAPDCDDHVDCTDDSCSDAEGGCVHAWRSDALEGPRGDATCQDGADNDCDGTSDAADATCRFGLTSANPIDGPEAGGTVVTLSGDALDLARKAYVDGVEVPFERVDATRMTVTMPAHAAGYVDFRIEADTVSFVLAQAFRYLARSEDPNVTAVLVGPLGEATINEGQQAPDYVAEVTVPGITDADPLDPSALKGQVGYGPRGTLPWADPGWRWANASGTATGLGSMRFTGGFTVAVGGYLDATARFSVDGGASWVYADLDGTGNGYDVAQVLPLTVFGVPRAGAIVLNELLWSGSFQDDWDEWVELRNLSSAPYVLTGWTLTNMRYPSGDIVLDQAPQVVVNVRLEPHGYFLVSQYEMSKSQLAVVPDIALQPAASSTKSMRMPDTGPITYQLKGPDGTVVDQAKFTGRVGVHGTDANGKPVQSMERNAVAGTGLLDADWHSATISTGFKGDPRQTKNLGTPGAANTDIPLCATDDECVGTFPSETLTACEARACRLPQGRCGIVPIAEGGACDDGLYCTEGETCVAGGCGNGAARDCADASPCTIDACDEGAGACTHLPDATALEGPGGSDSCLDTVDNDCDGVTDVDDPQCGLKAVSLAPSPIPAPGGWEMTLTGTGLDLVTGVLLGGQAAASFQVVGSTTITFPAPFQTGPGDKDLQVTDGVVASTLVGAVRVIGVATTVLANTQYPTVPLLVDLGKPTPLIFGRVFADGYTNGATPVDPSAILAEIGYGPVDNLDSNPFLDLGWTWAPAQHNAFCSGCVDVYEYMSTLQPPAIGSYLIAFRFSVDGGFRYQYGQIGDVASVQWDPMSALVLTVQTPP